MSEGGQVENGQAPLENSILYLSGSLAELLEKELQHSLLISALITWRLFFCRLPEQMRAVHMGQMMQGAGYDLPQPSFQETYPLPQNSAHLPAHNSYPQSNFPQPSLQVLCPNHSRFFLIVLESVLVSRSLLGALLSGNTSICVVVLIS